MTINEADTQQQAEPTASVGPGTLLRDAREAKGWTQAEVARRLNLRLAVIESIDSDNHKAGVAITFLRGYVKAYAKVVGVPEVQALRAFDSIICQAPDTDIPMKSFSKKTRQQASDKWLKRISWLVFLGLLASLVYWWWQDGGAQQMGHGLPAVNQQAPTIDEAAPQTEAIGAQTKNVLEPTLLIPAEPTVNADSVIAPNHDNSELDTPEPSVIEEPAPTPESVANPNLLTLNFTDDCWIKITDSADLVLSEGVKKAKQTLVLEGKPPFRVILGVPTAASIEYMSQEVDLSSFSAGRAARLTIPKS